MSRFTVSAVRSNVVPMARKAKNYAFGVAFACAMLLLTLPAHAQTAGDGGGTTTGFVDYTALSATAKTELGGAVGKFVPTVISIVLSMVAIGLLIKWLRRAPKAS